MLLQHARYLTRNDLLHTAAKLQNGNRAYSTALELPFSISTRTIAKPRERYTLEQTWHNNVQCRGAKTKATLTLDEIPQGLIDSTALPPQHDTEPEYPPLLQQVRNNMLIFSHCVLVTRVGGFYEVLSGSLEFAVAKANSYTLSMRTSLRRF
jgi:hypothetical protein